MTYLPMKLPWIRSPTFDGFGTDTPTLKPSMANPRRMLLDALMTKPISAELLGRLLPSRITRTFALLPLSAPVVFGGDVKKVGLPATPPIVDVATATLGVFPPVKLLVAIRFGIASWA